MSTLGLFPNQAKLVVKPEAHLTHCTCLQITPAAHRSQWVTIVTAPACCRFCVDINTRLMAGAKRRTLTAVNGSRITTRWSPANTAGRALSHRIGGTTSGAGTDGRRIVRHQGDQTRSQSSRTQFIPLSLSHRLLTLPPCSFFHKYERDPSIF
jgi:hypothetical protein